jgi:hypothetical protein
VNTISVSTRGKYRTGQSKTSYEKNDSYKRGEQWLFYLPRLFSCLPVCFISTAYRHCLITWHLGWLIYEGLPSDRGIF